MRERACDGLDWVGPHSAPACAGASLADPEASPCPTNREVLRQRRRGSGPLNYQASRYAEEANERGRSESRTTKETTKKEEDKRARGGGERRIQHPHGTVPSVQVREEGDAKEVGGPNRGRRVRTPGSRMGLPATLQEERGRGRCVAVA
ncbi:hypothetical protein NDU88_008121 [Pleurodeles waltl]|uniref:Uncharacterized protein n=1 Tax=Pleurodeles waltl TaxID=8319 RepID=A0AAV7PNA9_PLEWA|nr:hypothetical protein NDU88_008121 [Pleurodeles waltl]